MNQILNGFNLLSQSDNSPFVITYKTTGMGCMVAFLLILSLILGGTFLGFAMSDPSVFYDFVFVAWWTPICAFCGFLAIVIFFLSAIWHLFGMTTFTMTNPELMVSRKLFFLKWGKSLKREQIDGFEQIKDGGEDEDSFPSWGLNVRGARRMSLLSRQPIDKSDWLGKLLAEYYNADYLVSTNREN